MPEPKKIPDENDEMVAQFLNELLRESERGAALIGAAACDEAIEHLLQTAMRPEKSLLKKLFTYPGPLSGLASRTDTARAFGLLDSCEYRILTLIRTIRSKHAAHSIAAFSFDSPKVRQICEELLTHLKGPLPMEPTPRNVFSVAVARIFGLLNAHAASLQDLREKHPDRSLLEMYAPFCDRAELRNDRKESP